MEGNPLDNNMADVTSDFGIVEDKSEALSATHSSKSSGKNQKLSILKTSLLE